MKSAGKPHLHFEVQSTGKCDFRNESRAGIEHRRLRVPGRWQQKRPDRLCHGRRAAIRVTEHKCSYEPGTLPEGACSGRRHGCGAPAATATSPNSCSTRPDRRGDASSSGDSDNTNAMAGGEGTYMTSSGSAIANADADLRSLAINMTRQSALELRAASSMAQNLQGRTDSAIAHMLMLMTRRGWAMSDIMKTAALALAVVAPAAPLPRKARWMAAMRTIWPAQPPRPTEGRATMPIARNFWPLTCGFN